MVGNPTGTFVIGGPDGVMPPDRRKISVDTYGGCRHRTGRAFSGKDRQKVVPALLRYCRALSGQERSSPRAGREKCTIS